MMRVALFVLEKQAMVFLFAEITLEKSRKKVDKCMNILFGETLAQKVSKFLPACKLQKAGE